MCYFSITSIPLKGFCNCLNRRLFSFVVVKGARWSLSFSGVWSLQDVTDMDDPFMAEPCRDVPWSWLASHQKSAKRESLLSGESTRKPSCGKVNQCDYWLEVIKWLISATFSWRREFWRQTYGCWKRGNREDEYRGKESCRLPRESQ